MKINLRHPICVIWEARQGRPSAGAAERSFALRGLRRYCVKKGMAQNGTPPERCAERCRARGPVGR